MRGIYTAGVYDYMLDRGIKIDYGIGVSAGAANMITFLAGQRGRTLKFYAEYSFRKEYMSLANWLKHRNYLDLDYIYSTLTNRGGEYPLDYEAFSKNTTPFLVTATDAQTGATKYFTKKDVAQDRYDILKASCAIPLACRPYPVGGRLYFDGGVALPMPYQKALDDGCDKIVVLSTRARDYVKPKQKNLWVMKRALKKFPVVFGQIERRHEVYNRSMLEILKLEKQGKALLVAPSDSCGVDTLTRDKDAFMRLYQKGYEDGATVEKFIQK